MWVYVCTFMLGESFKMVVFGCVCGCVVYFGLVCGLWCPSMRRGDVVGVPIGGGWVEGMSEKGWCALESGRGMFDR